MSILEIVLLVWACVATGMAWHYKTLAIGGAEAVRQIAYGEIKVSINKITGGIDVTERKQP
jgi:histidinol dehydrogenase